MFPVSDFNFVVAGIATFAATVGYACTRQLSASLYDLLFANPIDEMLNLFYDVRSGPVSPHDAGLEQVQEEASAEPSSSNLDDTNQDITSTLSSQESLKRKIPDDGFDEDNVRIFSSVALLLPIRAILIINRRNLDTLMLVSMDK